MARTLLERRDNPLRGTGWHLEQSWEAGVSDGRNGIDGTPGEALLALAVLEQSEQRRRQAEYCAGIAGDIERTRLEPERLAAVAERATADVMPAHGYRRVAWSAWCATTSILGLAALAVAAELPLALYTVAESLGN